MQFIGAGVVVTIVAIIVIISIFLSFVPLGLWI